ncbi:hypothetical protein JHK87_009518 [Glycine soja]|nr:hypothetical protein JHK87_009518 [Glycine soja]
MPFKTILVTHKFGLPEVEEFAYCGAKELTQCGEILSLHSLSGSSSVEWIQGSLVSQRQPLTWYKVSAKSMIGLHESTKCAQIIKIIGVCAPRFSNLISQTLHVLLRLFPPKVMRRCFWSGRDAPSVG